MRDAGIALTAVGAMSMTVSIVFLVKTFNPCDGSCHDVEALGGMAWGIGAGVAGLVGLAGLGVGIPLWAIGQRDELVSPDDPRAVEALSKGATSWLPEVRLGVGAVQASWRW